MSPAKITGTISHLLLAMAGFVLLLTFTMGADTAFASAAVDCEGSAQAYRLQGIPCYCRGEQIVCDQASSGGHSTSASHSAQMKGMVVGTILESILTSVFAPPQLNEQARLAEQQKAAALAAQYMAQKKAAEAAAQAAHEKMMESYKQLDGAQQAGYKGLSDSKMNFKTLDDSMGALAYSKTGGNDYKDPETVLEQIAFDVMNDAWMNKQKELIELRTNEPNPYAGAISASLKTHAPPPLSPRKYEELQPGDVILISPDDRQSFWVNFADRLSSASLSPASHTVLYLREVNGKKLFLDHTLEGGSHVISEAEFLKTYGRREAQVAQPVNRPDADAIWATAKKIAKRETEIQEQKSENIISHPLSQTGYGLYGDSMVCSEASRLALVQAGQNIPETDSPLKKVLGIHYGPANFFSDEYNFVITPLWTSNVDLGN
jgi:hypothetical protein